MGIPFIVHAAEYIWESCLYMETGKIIRSAHLISLSVLNQSEFPLSNRLLSSNGAL